MRVRRRLIAVIGSARLAESDHRYQLARDVGRLLVDGGARVLTGGMGGVMEAASRGATESARYQPGDTVGLLPGLDPSQANEWVDIILPTGLDHLRNGLVANADTVIAIGGGAGTLSEIAFAWMRRRPIVALDPADVGIVSANTAAEACAHALAHCAKPHAARSVGGHFRGEP